MKHIVFSGLLSLLLADAASAVEFKTLTRNAIAYHGQKVTVKGVARVQGLSFHLYGNASDARRFASGERAIVVSQNSEGPRYDRYDNRWIEISGTVDAHQRSAWGYPCVVFLDAIKALPLPAPGKQHVVIEGIFKNEDPEDIIIVLFSDRGRMYAQIPVAAYQSNGTGIRGGVIEIRSATDRKVVWRSALPQDLKYFDRAGRKYYYRIVHGKLEAVTPEDAKRLWRKERSRGSELTIDTNGQLGHDVRRAPPPPDTISRRALSRDEPGRSAGSDFPGRRRSQ